MKCPKCGGLLYPRHISYLGEHGEELYCVNCGATYQILQKGERDEKAASMLVHMLTDPPGVGWNK